MMTAQQIKQYSFGGNSISVESLWNRYFLPAIIKKANFTSSCKVEVSLWEITCYLGQLPNYTELLTKTFQYGRDQGFTVIRAAGKDDPRKSAKVTISW